MKPVRIACLLFLIGSAALGAEPPDRVGWFREARFGMMVHWGIYSVPAGEWNGKTSYSEKIQQQTKMPSVEYLKFADQFDPVHFDARQWAALAKTAGMKYIAITAKHHDGFCMFDTKLTDYNVVARSPWHHDPIADLAVAARAAGLKLCFYYSVPDWHDPDFPPQYSPQGFHGNAGPNPNIDHYVDFMKGQLRELLSNYGPIGLFWFEAPGLGGDRAKLIHAQEILDEIHQVQPDCLIDNSLGLSADFATRRASPPSRSDTPFQVCTSLNDSWGYNKADNHWKSAATIVQTLADAASKGGNLLLNVGAESDGTFPPEAVSVLNDVGQWMSRYGDSIYGTYPAPPDSPPAWGRITRTGNTFYLHVFNWPANGVLTVTGLGKGFRHASLLGDSRGTSLAGNENGESINLTLPPAAPDPIDSVIVMECQ